MGPVKNTQNASYYCWHRGPCRSKAAAGAKCPRMASVLSSISHSTQFMPAAAEPTWYDNKAHGKAQPNAPRGRDWHASVGEEQP